MLLLIAVVTLPARDASDPRLRTVGQTDGSGSNSNCNFDKQTKERQCHPP